jgi:hypothetical protein
VVTAAADLAITEVLLLDAPTASGNVVSNPAVGDQVYPAVRYSYTGSAPFNGKVWRVTLNGSEVGSFSGTLNESGNFIGRSNTPWTVTSGTHEICAYLDPDSALSESNENNNSRCNAYQLTSSSTKTVEINHRVNYGNCWNATGTVNVPGATRMRLVLKSVDVEEDYDELRVSTGDRFSGQFSEVYTDWANQSSISLTLVSDDTVSGSFIIARAEYESTEAKSAGTDGKLFTENGDKCATGGGGGTGGGGTGGGGTGGGGTGGGGTGGGGTGGGGTGGGGTGGGGTVFEDDFTPQGWAGAAKMTLSMREEVLPPSVRIDPSATVSPLTDLALRLSAEESIDASSIWTELTGPEGADYEVFWRFTVETADNDGWVVFRPLMVLEEGAVVTLTAGAKTLGGDALPKVTETFVIAAAPKAAYSAEPALLEAREIEALPHFLAAPHSPVYRLAPVGAYLEPVTLQVPVPRGLDAASLELFYYSESGSLAGWYRGSEVEGWIVPGSRRTVEEGGVRYLEFQVNHSGVVQLGQATLLQMGSLGSVEFGASGTGSRWASLFTTVLGLMLLLGYAQQRQTVRSSENPQA